MRRAAVIAVCLGAASCTPPPLPPPPPPPPTVVDPPPPAPTDPAPVVDGDIGVAYENGLRVVVKRTPGAELVAMQLYIKGGARLRQKETAGVELMALRVAGRGGTTALDKQAFHKKLAALGSELSVSSFHAYSVIAAKALTGKLDQTLAMLAGVLMTPAMPAAEVEVVREQMLAGIKRREETPDGRLDLLVTQTVYRGHPYQHLSSGTLESVTPLALEALKQHLAGLRQTSRLELVVVGDVALDHVRELVRGHLATLPRGDYDDAPLPAPRFARAKLEVVAAELPTNYIEASFIGPRWQDKDFVASVLAMRILSRRVWEEVRTKRNLSYAPGARYGWSGEITRGSLYVTAVDPNTTMKVMLDEAHELKTTLVDDKELAGAKSVFLTSHLMANEATDGQASWLAMCDLVGGDWRLSRTLPERVKAVTAADVQAFAQKHLVHLQTVVLGDPAKIDRALFESL